MPHGGTYYTPYSASPPCATPGYPPSTMIPPAAAVPPGAARPGAPAPGAPAPGAPAPGAQAQDAAAAAAAAATADPGTGAGGERGSDALASAAPQMIGDLSSSGFVVISSSSSSFSRGSSSTGPRIPIGARSGFKISENESPAPQTRVFLTYNYFNGINTFGGGHADLHRGLAGFEFAMMDGAASIGVRMPYTQGTGDGAVGLDGFGDLSIIGKYAFYRDNQTGDVVSGGLVVTTPTGFTTRLPDGSSINSVILQPWAGFILSMDNVYAQGFTAVIVPTETKDVTLYTADLGVGYRLYRCNSDQLLTSITPTVETHINIPLNHSSQTSTIFFPDQITMTGGVHFGLCGTSRLTLAAAVPVTGPRLYDVEFVAQLNLGF
jgi:hypothetical protein